MIIDPWTSKTARRKLQDRLSRAREARKAAERQWDVNERTVYNTTGSISGLGITSDVVTGGEPDVEVASNTGVNHTFRNLRLIHAQMSANPPTAIPHATTSDPEDRRRARAADRILQFARRQYRIQEVTDQCNLGTLLHGIGYICTTWDPMRGDVVEFDEETGRLTMEGDLSIRAVSARRLLVDPDAASWDEVRFVFEEMTVTYEEAIHRWPERRRLIESLLDEVSRSPDPSTGVVDAVQPHRGGREVITVYAYWETGLPANGNLGRYTVCAPDGRLLEPISESPFSFSPPPSATEEALARREGRSPRRLPPRARLPFHPLTDVDVPGSVYGKSVVEFEAPLQDLLNRLDSVTLENVQANGVARVLLPDGIEVAPGQLTNSPWDVLRLKGEGTGKPEFMPPMVLPQAITELRMQTRAGLDDMAGTNDSMFGVPQDRQSGFSMQYAVNQGNLIRRRLFNKYVAQIESVYRAILDLVRKHWTTPRTIQVLGKEKAFEVVDFEGSDIDGGFDFQIEYGSSLSLDPLTRRQEIMNLMPIMEKAQVPPRLILSMLKLGEVDVVDDLVQLAEDRQRETFEVMLAEQRQIEPRQYQDHANMLAYAFRYVMTADFQYLSDSDKQLIEEHIRLRTEQAAKEAAPPSAAPTAGIPPGPMGQPAGIPGEPAAETAAPAAPTEPAEAGGPA